MAQTQLIIVPADWPEPHSLQASLRRCGIQLEGLAAMALERYAQALEWLRRFAEEIRRRVHEAHSHPRRQQVFTQQGVAARELEILRGLMRATIRPVRVRAPAKTSQLLVANRTELVGAPGRS